MQISLYLIFYAFHLVLIWGIQQNYKNHVSTKFVSFCLHCLMGFWFFKESQCNGFFYYLKHSLFLQFICFSLTIYYLFVHWFILLFKPTIYLSHPLLLIHILTNFKTILILTINEFSLFLLFLTPTFLLLGSNYFFFLLRIFHKATAVWVLRSNERISQVWSRGCKKSEFSDRVFSWVFPAAWFEWKFAKDPAWVSLCLVRGRRHRKTFFSTMFVATTSVLALAIWADGGAPVFVQVGNFSGLSWAQSNEELAKKTLLVAQARS